MTTGLTLNLTAADTYCSLTVGGASATANAQATVGNWEPFSSAGTVLTSRPTKATAALINNNPASAEASATAAINVGIQLAPAGADIDVSSYLLGHQLLPSGPEGAFGFEFDVPLNEEYVITSNLASVSSASAVPEPGALSLLLVGTVGIAAWRRKRA